MSKVSKEKKTAIDWIDDNKDEVIAFLMDLWRHPETAFREYRSAKKHCELLKKYGFKVKTGIAGLPTAFVAEWGSGKPVIGTYAEYDATPEQNQDAVPYRKPFVEYGPGWSDAHHSLGTGSTVGAIATKIAMEKHGLKGTVRVFGTPAEKVCAKVWLASKGFLDGHDAFITNHPLNANTVAWETQLGSYYAVVFRFKCDESEKWIAYAPSLGAFGSRHPGAMDALVTMHLLVKMMKDRMLPFTANWTLNEWIMMAGQMTADNIPPRIAEVNYAWRSPYVETNEEIWKVMQNCAQKAAEATGCKVETIWVSKTRHGLPNLAIARLAYRNMELVGAPKWSKEDIEFAKEIQRNLGLKPMEKPLPEGLVPPEEAEKLQRQMLPPNVTNSGSDDNSEFTWHAPSAWIHVAGGFGLSPYPGVRYPRWVEFCINGTGINHKMTLKTAQIIAASMIELFTEPAELKKCQDEFKERTGGGVGGSKWLAPLLPRDMDPPINLRWPEWIRNTYEEELDTTKAKWHIPY